MSLKLTPPSVERVKVVEELPAGLKTVTVM
ncbi:hypothetical protein GBAR_LOCUS8701, partial [Geodia barretti]